MNAGKVFPLLFDLTPTELRRICPPLADFQGVSLRNREDLRRLTEKMARTIGLRGADLLALRSRFDESHPTLRDAVADTVDTMRLLPDSFAGTISFNHHITASANLQMPELFRSYERELLLVGINLAFLFNLRNGTENASAMLDSLLAHPSRRVYILISDLWDEKVLYTYDKVAFGNGATEFKAIDRAFTDRGDGSPFDRLVRDHAPARYEDLRRRLIIKTLPLLADTFWFVDADGRAGNGSMMFALMTTATGRDRPVYYVDQRHEPELFAKYYDVCRAAFELSATTLWPA